MGPEGSRARRDGEIKTRKQRNRNRITNTGMLTEILRFVQLAFVDLILLIILMWALHIYIRPTLDFFCSGLKHAGWFVSDSRFALMSYIGEPRTRLHSPASPTSPAQPLLTTTVRQ